MTENILEKDITFESDNSPLGDKRNHKVYNNGHYIGKLLLAPTPNGSGGFMAMVPNVLLELEGIKVQLPITFEELSEFSTIEEILQKLKPHIVEVYNTIKQQGEHDFINQQGGN